MNIKVGDRMCCLHNDVSPIVQAGQCIKVVEVGKDTVTFVTAADGDTLSKNALMEHFRKVDCFGCKTIP